MKHGHSCKILYLFLQLIHVPLILVMLARLAHQIQALTEAIYVNVHQDMQEIVMSVKVCILAIIS